MTPTAASCRTNGIIATDKNGGASFNAGGHTPNATRMIMAFLGAPLNTPLSKNGRKKKIGATRANPSAADATR